MAMAPLCSRACPARVTGTCPTTILCNLGALAKRKDEMAGAVLRHEAGHVLGLCSNPEHGDRSHCHNYGCLMMRAPSFGSWLGVKFGASWEAKLCEDCECDIENARLQPSPDNLSFAGPFLVRHEDGYDVISQERCALLFMGPTGKPYDWRALLAQVKKNIRKGIEKGTVPRKYKGTQFQCAVLTSPDIAAGSEQYQAILREAAQDPSPPISRVAQILLKKLTGDGPPKGTSP